ncbi:uncharacterized protein LOC132279413 isoform X3 [Cornus florida]|uniref:uncharacterized protein LOC132279413 isoform X3 n=1 Tax=Cornus florida TaxID=4283 RepID=UPI00289ACF27|nr:uncharacterized protein LOC132279413 isoform X3 [Cornus florida]
MLARHDGKDNVLNGVMLIDSALMSMTLREMYQGVLRKIPGVVSSPFRVPYFDVSIEQKSCAHLASFGEMRILFCKTIFFDLHFGLTNGSRWFSTYDADVEIVEMLKMRFIEDGHKQALFKNGCLLPKWMSTENLQLPRETKFLTEIDYMNCVGRLSNTDQWHSFVHFLRKDLIYVVEGNDESFLKHAMNRFLWHNPCNFYPVANVDASVDEYGNASVAVVIRSPNGVIENTFFMSLEGKMSSRSAEVKSGELAILVASELGYDSLEIRSDSGDYVNGMRGKFKTEEDDLEFINCRVQRKLGKEKFGINLKVVFVLREVNAVADFLSRISQIRASMVPGRLRRLRQNRVCYNLLLISCSLLQNLAVSSSKI